MKPKQIKTLREREHVSQTVFANYLNVTPNLVSKWERGEKRSSGPALKLLSLVEKHGLSVVAQFAKPRSSPSTVFVIYILNFGLLTGHSCSRATSNPRSCLTSLARQRVTFLYLSLLLALSYLRIMTSVLNP